MKNNSFRKQERHISNRSFFNPFLYLQKKWSYLSAGSLILLTVSALLLIFWSTITASIHKLSAGEDPVGFIRKHQKELKHAALEAMSIDYFSGYSYNRDPSRRRAEIHAKLIHKYASDFYGKPYGLTRDDEIRLYALISYNGFNTADLCNLGMPQMSDTVALEQRIYEKISGYEPQTPYFNPVIDHLRQTRRIYISELEKELYQPLDDRVLNVLEKNIPVKSMLKDSLIRQAAGILSTNQHLLGTLRYYKQIIGELDMELNLRLAIIYYGIGKDYGISDSREFFGWFRDGYSGKSLIARKWVPRKSKDAHTRLRSAYREYARHLAGATAFYTGIDLNDWQLRLHSPLYDSLSVKQIGLFGARRKHLSGRIYKHQGVDLVAEDGTPVYPVQDGFVVYVGNQENGWGNHVRIWHDANLVSTYSHLKSDAHFSRLLKRFELEGPFAVTRNARIASVGRTGNIPRNDPQYGYSHLHLEIKRSGNYINPLVLLHEHFRVVH